MVYLSVGHFTRSVDCYEGLHLNKACLIPLPSVTSLEPDSTESGDCADEADDPSGFDSLPKTFDPLLRRHLPGCCS